jgi:UDP-N-acetylglucosamine 3-dehydrogenase
MIALLRAAIVGAGNIGRTHAGVYRDDPLARLVAICDVVREKADALAAEVGARAYYDVSQMLEAEEIDVISVTTAGPENGGHHYEPVMQALAAGKAVLCEKPLSNDIAQAREMVAEARERGLYLGVNLNHRFVPLAARARQYVTDGALGELCFVNMALWIRNPNESSPWFHLRALHPHSIDVMRYFCGDIVKVQAFLKQASHRSIWSNASINMLFANGMVGHLTGSYDMTTVHPFERCEVAGTQGRFVLDNVYESLTFYPHASAETTVIRNSIMGGVASFRDTFVNRIHRFLEQVSEGVSPDELEGSGVEALAAQEVIEAAIRSWETSSIVDVAPVAV